MHCMNDCVIDVKNVFLHLWIVYGALESVAVLWRLRIHRDIIIIIIISLTFKLLSKGGISDYRSTICLLSLPSVR